MGWNVTVWDKIFHLELNLSCEANVMSKLLLSCGTKCYHLSSWTKCYHLEFMLSWGMKCWYVGLNDITWDEMLSSGMKCCHLEQNVIMCNKSSLVEEDVVIWSILWCKVHKKLILSSGVVMWCYHVGWHPLFIIPESFSHSKTLVFLNNNLQVTISYGMCYTFTRTVFSYLWVVLIHWVGAGKRGLHW